MPTEPTDESSQRVVLDRVSYLLGLRNALDSRYTNTGLFLDTDEGRYEAHCWAGSPPHAAWILSGESAESALAAMVAEGLVIPPALKARLDYMAKVCFKNEKAHTMQQTSKANAGKKEAKDRKVLFMRHLEETDVNRKPKGISEKAIVREVMDLLEQRAASDPELAAALAALRAKQS